MAFDDEDPSVRIPLDRSGEVADDTASEGAVMIPFKDINLQPGVSCVEQFRKFFGTTKIEDLIRISQDDNVINTDDPYIKYLLEEPERIAREIESLEAYVRANAAVLTPAHEAVLSNFVIFLKRLETYAESLKPEPMVFMGHLYKGGHQT